MSAKPKEPAKAARLILADAARETRSTLRRDRLPVDPQLTELASRRRGVAAARQLTMLADEMLMAYGPDAAARRFAEMGAAFIAARRIA